MDWTTFFFFFHFICSTVALLLEHILFPVRRIYFIWSWHVWEQCENFVQMSHLTSKRMSNRFFFVSAAINEHRGINGVTQKGNNIKKGCIRAVQRTTNILTLLLHYILFCCIIRGSTNSSSHIDLYIEKATKKKILHSLKGRGSFCSTLYRTNGMNVCIKCIKCVRAESFPRQSVVAVCLQLGRGTRVMYVLNVDIGPVRCKMRHAHQNFISVFHLTLSAIRHTHIIILCSPFVSVSIFLFLPRCRFAAITKIQAIQHTHEGRAILWIWFFLAIARNRCNAFMFQSWCFEKKVVSSSQRAQWIKSKWNDIVVL